MPTTRPAAPTRLLRLTEVMQIVPFSKMHLYRLEQDGKFPRRVHLGPGRVAWDANEISEWVEAKKAARNEPVSERVPTEAARRAKAAPAQAQVVGRNAKKRAAG